MSKFNEPLKIEVIGKALVIDIYVPDTRQEKSMKAKGLTPVGAPTPKNKLWEDSTQRLSITEFDEHPVQGIVKAISSVVLEEEVGTIKINDRIAVRVGAGEPVVYQNRHYLRIAPHEIMFKYLGTER